MKDLRSSYGGMQKTVSPGIQTWTILVHCVMSAPIRRNISVENVSSIMFLGDTCNGEWDLHSMGHRCVDIASFLDSPPDNFAVSIANLRNFQVFGTLLMYSLWDARNQAKYSNKMISLADFLQMLDKLFAEHTADNRTGSDSSHNTILSAPQPITDNEMADLLSSNYIRINTDAAFTNGRACRFGIARNSTGHLPNWLHKIMLHEPFKHK